MTLRKPGLLTGALIGGLLTAPLVAVFYAGWKLAGPPFPAFNVFDWTARVLPGPVVTAPPHPSGVSGLHGKSVML